MKGMGECNCCDAGFQCDRLVRVGVVIYFVMRGYGITGYEVTTKIPWEDLVFRRYNRFRTQHNAQFKESKCLEGVFRTKLFVMKAIYRKAAVRPTVRCMHIYAQTHGL